MTKVRLRNGAKAESRIVRGVYLSLKGLLEKGYIIQVLEVISLARDPKHELSKEVEQFLKDVNLLEHDGEMDETTRNIILSSIEGNGLEAVLMFPIVNPS